MRSKTDRAICGTCQYWTCAREPIFDDSGNCEHPQSAMYEQNRKKDGKCKCYYKWTELL